MKDLILMIGTNLGERNTNINIAMSRLQYFFGLPIVVGDLYETEPWGYETDKLFYNRAVIYSTDLLPIEVLHICKSIEIEMGRKKTFDTRYENRIIDIDIIIYGDVVVEEMYLKIPHRQLVERRFVLEPIAEIVPNFVHPILKKTIKQLLSDCTDTLKVKKVTDNTYHHDRTNISIPEYDYITIEGCIGAGKTTLATRLAKDFNGKLILEQFADNPFLPKFYADKDKYAFPVELSFLASRYKQLHDNLLDKDLFTNVTIADYFLYKSAIFAGRTLTDDMYNLYRNMFNIIKTKLPEPKLIVYLYLTTDNLLQNISKRGRVYEKSITGDYLQTIQNGYLDYFKQQTTNRVVIVDTNHMDFVGKEGDYEQLRDIVKSSWPIGVTKVV